MYIVVSSLFDRLCHRNHISLNSERFSQNQTRNKRQSSSVLPAPLGATIIALSLSAHPPFPRGERLSQQLDLQTLLPQKVTGSIENLPSLVSMQMTKAFFSHPIGSVYKP